VPDKLMSYFFDPNWINQLKDKNEKLAENIGVGAKTITNYGLVKKCAVIKHPKSWIGRYQAA